MEHLIIFTDLDGTLMDHDTYSWRPAEATLRRLDGLGIPLVLNSSKTVAEITGIRERMRNRHPFIVENGGAVCIPNGYFDSAPGAEAFRTHIFGKPYAEILSILIRIRESHDFGFRGFSDLTDDELSDLTDLPLADVIPAKKRCCSEPIIWADCEKNFDTFCALLQRHDLRVISGGRFFHVMGDTDKGRAMRWLLDRYREAEPERRLTTIALGDRPNDRPMLEQADQAVVVKPKNGTCLALNRIDNVIYTEQAGPAGWQAAVDTLLDQRGV